MLAAQAGHLPVAQVALIDVRASPLKKRKRKESELDSFIHHSTAYSIVDESKKIKALSLHGNGLQ